MKIAVVAPTQMPARRANTFQVVKMAQAFVNLGHTVRLAVPADQAPKELLPEDEHGWNEFAHHYGLERRFPVEWLACNAFFRRYDYGLTALRWAREWQAELIYTRLPQCAALASLLGAPTIFEIHDIPQGVAAPLLLRTFLRGSGKRRLVVISKALVDQLHAKLQTAGIASITFIAPDGVDLNRYAHLPSPSEARQTMLSKIPALTDRFTVGYTGNFYAGRGVELIFKIASCLPEFNFLLVGGEQTAVEKWTKAVNTGNLQNVFVVGFVPNQELPMYQACCEALLMPYQERVEASSGGNIAPYLSPLKAFEYLASGRVILSSDTPVLREILTDETAILLPPTDVEAWIAALKRVREDRQYRERLATAARQAAGQYSWEARASAILASIRRV